MSVFLLYWHIFAPMRSLPLLSDKKRIFCAEVISRLFTLYLANLLIIEVNLTKKVYITDLVGPIAVYIQKCFIQNRQRKKVFKKHRNKKEKTSTTHNKIVQYVMFFGRILIFYWICMFALRPRSGF